MVMMHFWKFGTHANENVCDECVPGLLSKKAAVVSGGKSRARKLDGDL